LLLVALKTGLRQVELIGLQWRLAAIARDGQDLFMVQFYEAGQCHIARGAPMATSEPGDPSYVPMRGME
jgi:hypothetical protein